MTTIYQSFLINNASQITAVESTLRSLTYFLPGRFKDAELASEAIFSALNVLGFYHDSILSDLVSISENNIGIAPSATAPSLSLSSSTGDVKAGGSAGSGSSAPLSVPATHTPSQHARYTNYWARSSAVYKHASQALLLLSHTELLIEMLAVRYHRQLRASPGSASASPAARVLAKAQPMDVVVLLEALKAALRLVLWRCTAERTLLAANPLPEREVDPAELELERRAKMDELFAKELQKQRSEAAEKLGLVGSSAAAQALAPRDRERDRWDAWRGKRTGLTRPTLRSLRPGAHEAVAAGLLRPLPPHPLAPSSSSDSDETTLIDPDEEEDDAWRTQEAELAKTPAAPRPPGWTDAQVNSFLLSRTLAPTDVLKPTELVRPVFGNVGRLAEILWIIRPVLYALAIRRYGKHARLPFYISLIVEFLARQLRKRSYSPSGLGFGQRKPPAANPLLGAFGGGGGFGGGNFIANTLIGALTGAGAAADSEAKRRERPVSTVEANEWARRDSSFWWYLLRGPCWDSFTRPRLERIIASLENRPLLGLLGGILGDYLPLVDEYYFYTSK